MRIASVVLGSIAFLAPAAAMARGSHGGGGGGGGGGGHGGGGGGGGYHGGGGGSAGHSTGGGGGGGYHGGGGGGWHGGGGTTVDHRGGGGGGWHGGGGTTVDHRGNGGYHGGPGGGGPGGYHPGGGGYVGGVWVDGGSGTYYDDSGYYGCSDEGCGDLHYDNGSVPTWTWEVGGLARTFRGPAFSRSGTVVGYDGYDHAYTLTGGDPSARDTSALAAQLRATFTASQHLYLGGELELGGLMRSPLTVTSDGDVAQIASTTMFGAAAVIGVRTRAGALEIDGEVAGGVRAFSTTVTSDTMDTADAPVDTIAMPLVETRVRGALWFTPTWFLGAQLGAGVLDRSDVSFAVVLGSATRPYADPYAPPAY